MNKDIRQLRVTWIDTLRGLTVISMVAYHAMWDAVYLFGFKADWYRSDTGYVWQQSICWVFILLAGYCWCYSKRPLNRGIKISLIGVLMTTVTLIVMPDQRIIFGVMTFLGASILLMIPCNKLFERMQPLAGLLISIILFVVMRNCNDGYLGFEAWDMIKLPDSLYKNYFTSFLGFPFREFFSADYFPMFPWLWLFCVGYFVKRCLDRAKVRYEKLSFRVPVVDFIGKKALIIYVVHQPIIYLLFMIGNEVMS